MHRLGSSGQSTTTVAANSVATIHNIFTETSRFGSEARQRLSLTPLTPNRAVFCLMKRAGDQETVLPSAGYGYQMNPTKTVALKRTPETNMLQPNSSTVVLRACLCSNRPPEAVWEVWWAKPKSLEASLRDSCRSSTLLGSAA